MYIEVDGEKIKVNKTDFSKHGFIDLIDDVVDEIILYPKSKTYEEIMKDTERLLNVLKILCDNEELHKIALEIDDLYPYMNIFTPYIELDDSRCVFNDCIDEIIKAGSIDQVENKKKLLIKLEFASEKIHSSLCRLLRFIEITEKGI